MQEMVLTSPKSAHKSMKDQCESVSSYIVDYLWDQPAIYCGTYKKYNEGSLFGAWLDLRTFDSYEEFIDVCKQLHADEEDPELMFQDYQCFPEEWYSESCMDEEVFDKIIAFIQMDDDKQKAFKAYVSATGDDSISDFEDSYEGGWGSCQFISIRRRLQGVCSARTTSSRMATSSADKGGSRTRQSPRSGSPSFYCNQEIYSP